MVDMVDTEYAQFRQAAVTLLGANLRAARAKAGLSQEALAHRAGIAVFTYGQLERGLAVGGGQNPTIDTLLRVCLALRIDLSDLAR
jgi:transcriptional regulator with XRE-family HTH domain